MNVGAICLVWVFTFTAYSGLQNLESSLNARVGTYSLAGITGGGFITCLLAPAVISKIGCKGALVISWVCLAVFVGANYYPRAYVLIPGAVVEGLATGRMWTAQGVYVTTCAFEYSQLTGEALDEVLSRMFGVFCMAFQSTQVWGNLISSVVLNKEQAAGHRDNSTADLG
nr:hypothetical protein BaRGS_029614 [Batillaria attramentaria]